MDTETGGTNMVASPGTEASDSVGQVIEMAQVVIEERDAELASLRERLAFYEAFDSLINDNVARSADLFRSLYEERERLRADAARQQAETEATATLEADRRLAVQREKTQSMLTGLMDEATRMQRQIDGLIQRLAEAISESTVHGLDQRNRPEAENRAV